jgi:hypothetical protein
LSTFQLATPETDSNLATIQSQGPFCETVSISTIQPKLQSSCNQEVKPHITNRIPKPRSRKHNSPRLGDGELTYAYGSRRHEPRRVNGWSNVQHECVQFQFRSRNPKANSCILDALHLGHNESLHYLPLVARPNESRTDILPPWRRCSDRWLRSHSICLETIRSLGCEETGGSAS